MTRAHGLIFTFCTLALAGFAATRLSFNVDLLDLLPQDLREVRGLREFVDRFSGEGELIVILDDPTAEPETMEGRAGALAAHLRAADGLVSRVGWQPVWQQDPAVAAALPAYLWLNGPPADVRALAERLAEGRSVESLAAAIEELSFGIDGETLAFTAYDPFGLLRPPSAAGTVGIGGGGDGKFASADGSFRALYLSPPAGTELGYREAAEWMATVAAEVEVWRAREAVPDGLRIGYTGEPAFEAEIGTGMQRDMTGSILGATVLIHLLFWLMNRRMLPLVAMFLSLTMVLSLTVLAGSVWIGKLSVMSVGFAAILVGLAVDYGVVLYQQARAGDGSVRALHRAVGPGILWAALTTSAVFASLGLSSLPGVRELGLLVAVGILLGAGLMLKVFAPIAAKLGAQNPVPPRSAGARRDGGSSRNIAPAVTLVLLGAIAAVLLTKGLPGFYTSFDALRPKDSKADDAFTKLSGRLADDGGDSLPLVITAGSYVQLAGRAAAAGQTVAKLRDSGALESAAFLPDLVPSAERQVANSAVLRKLLGEEQRLARELDADFGPEAQGALTAVFGSWREMLAGENLPAVPVGAAARRLFRQAVNEDPPGVAVLGILRLAEGGWPKVRDAFASMDGAYLTGWPTLGPAVRPLVMHDVTAVFVPMGVVLLVMLVVVFRNLRDFLLAVGVLVLSGSALLALMRVANWDWDLLNVCAFPLLLGIGIDYTVHMIAALRRHGGDRDAVQRGIGRALLFCGVSTAIGFGSLALANNAGLASLGRVCASGVLVTMVVSVFLLPAWWRLASSAE